MNPKLTKPQLHRVKLINEALTPVMDAIEKWHELIFNGGNKELVLHRPYAGVIRHKEFAVWHLLQARKSINNMLGEQPSNERPYTRQQLKKLDKKKRLTSK